MSLLLARRSQTLRSGPGVTERKMGHSVMSAIMLGSGISRICHDPMPLRQRGDVAMWSTLFAFTFLIAVALSFAAIRLNL